MTQEVSAHVVRAEAARRLISQRFLAASAEETQPPRPAAIAFPAHMSLRSIRTGTEGSIMFTLHIPPEYTSDIWAPLVHIAGYPLAVTMEMIVDEADPFA